MNCLRPFFRKLKDELLQISRIIDQFFQRVDLQNKIAGASCSDAEIELLVISYCKKYDPDIQQDATIELITQLINQRPELYHTLMCGS